MNKFLEEITDFSKRQIVPNDKLVRFAFTCSLPKLESIFESFDNFRTMFFFSKPTSSYKFLAVGEIENLETNQFIRNISKGNSESDSIIHANLGCEIHENVPLVLGAEKFLSEKDEQLWRDFSKSKWFIPQVLIYENSDSSTIYFHYFGNKPPLDFFEQVLNQLAKTVTSIIFKKSSFKLTTQTEIENWTKAVNFALQEIRNNKLQKNVLARKVQLKMESKFSFSYALTELQNKYSECTTFAYKEASSIFFGATPEKLFSLSGDELETEALAGSTSRGANDDDDLIKESNLLNSTKEMNEHKNVLNFLINNLENFSKEVSYNVLPQIKKLSNIQHLQTPIKAKLKDEFDILEFQKAIHPTPAVCGLPQKKALELIKDLEYFDRGLYAGVIGWFNEKKRAEFVVGIRSAIINENVLTAFAGCGIVEGSDPVSEYHETELKFKPILSLLENEIVSQ